MIFGRVATLKPMLEYLAIPAWKTPPVSLDAWVDQLSRESAGVDVQRESSTVAWIEVESLGLRGYALIENGHPSAINFELLDPDPEPARLVLEAAAEALGWEIHADDDDDDDEDDDD